MDADYDMLILCSTYVQGGMLGYSCVEIEQVVRGDTTVQVYRYWSLPPSLM